MNENDKLKILAIIPARGGSKGVPRKNIRLLSGKPLIVYSIEAALESKYIDKVAVSTEDEEIAEISKDYDTEIIERPEELARDNTASLPVFKHVISFLENNKNYKPDIIVVLQPTSPLRRVSDINKCIEELIDEKCDSVITLKKVEHPPQWMVQIDKHGKVQNFLKLNSINRRQDAANVYIPNGAVYVTWRDVIMKHNTIRGADTRAVIMPQERSIDIDTELDFLIAESLKENEKN